MTTFEWCARDCVVWSSTVYSARSDLHRSSTEILSKPSAKLWCCREFADFWVWGAWRGLQGAPFHPVDDPSPSSVAMDELQRYRWDWHLSHRDFLWPIKVIWGREILYHSKAHIWPPIWLLWTSSLYLVPFSRYSTSKFLGFDLDLRPLKGHPGSKKFIPFESPYTTSYLTYMDTISLSRTVFEIFDFEIFREWSWPLTPKGHLGSKISYHLKAHIWLPIWLLLTQSLYLVPFSR